MEKALQVTVTTSIAQPRQHINVILALYVALAPSYLQVAPAGSNLQFLFGRMTWKQQTRGDHVCSS